MRINKFVAQASGLSRRAADVAIEQGRVLVDGQAPKPGQQVTSGQNITLDGRTLQLKTSHHTILLNKPVGYVVSRNGQGAKTMYDLLPANFYLLKPVGRLDKNSSGLLVLTDDGLLAHELTHPRFGKQKIYEVELDKPLAPLHRQIISDRGIQLDDGPSKLSLERLHDNDHAWRIHMSEGRNRQIRRTFAALGYEVEKLHRTHFGDYALPHNLTQGRFIALS